MSGIIEKIKGLFKCKSEKETEFESQQQEPKAEQCTEEQATSSEETGSD